MKNTGEYIPTKVRTLNQVQSLCLHTNDGSQEGGPRCGSIQKISMWREQSESTTENSCSEMLRLYPQIQRRPQTQRQTQVEPSTGLSAQSTNPMEAPVPPLKLISREHCGKKTPGEVLGFSSAIIQLWDLGACSMPPHPKAIAFLYLK